MRAIYCSQQLDGISAAAIVMRAARLRNQDVRLAGTLTFENSAEQFNAMTRLSGDLVFILDFLPDLAAVEKQLQAITVRNRIAYWNSHHPHDAAAGEMLKRYAHTTDLSGPVHNGPLPRERICAAELAQKRFLPNDQIAKELALMAHDNEFWKREHPAAQKLSDLIAAGIEPKELADALSRGIFWNDRFERVRNEYLLKRQEALNDLSRHTTIKNIAGINFGFALAQNMLPTSDAGQHLIDSHAGIDISVAIYRNCRISFRKRENCNISLAELAMMFGGGGHSYAAGARLGAFSGITRENFDKAVFLVDQKLREHLIGFNR